MAFLDFTRVFRVSRAVAMSVSNSDFFEAARLRGEKISWLLWREILPNILPPLLTEFGLRFSFMILFLSSLSFLGLGIQPPPPTGAEWSRKTRTASPLESPHRFCPPPPLPFSPFLSTWSPTGPSDESSRPEAENETRRNPAAFGSPQPAG